MSGPTFWGTSYLFDMMIALAPPGAVPVVGVLGPSDPSVPRTAAPWAPPPCGDKSSRDNVVFCVRFLSVSLEWMLSVMLGSLGLWGWSNVSVGAL